MPLELMNKKQIGMGAIIATIATAVIGIVFLIVLLGQGVIINAASTCGIVAEPDVANYVASKHGVVGLTRAAAVDYADQNIRINAVCPATTLTDQVRRVTRNDPEILKLLETYQPMKRMGKPDEIAAAVLFLASDDASFMTGHPMAVDGGALAI